MSRRSYRDLWTCSPWFGEVPVARATPVVWSTCAAPLARRGGPSNRYWCFRGGSSPFNLAYIPVSLLFCILAADCVRAPRYKLMMQKKKKGEGGGGSWPGGN